MQMFLGEITMRRLQKMLSFVAIITVFFYGEVYGGNCDSAKVALCINEYIADKSGHVNNVTQFLDRLSDEYVCRKQICQKDSKLITCLGNEAIGCLTAEGLSTTLDISNRDANKLIETIFETTKLCLQSLQEVTALSVALIIIPMAMMATIGGVTGVPPAGVTFSQLFSEYAAIGATFICSIISGGAYLLFLFAYLASGSKALFYTFLLGDTIASFVLWIPLTGVTWWTAAKFTKGKQERQMPPNWIAAGSVELLFIVFLAGQVVLIVADSLSPPP